MDMYTQKQAHTNICTNIRTHKHTLVQSLNIHMYTCTNIDMYTNKDSHVQVYLYALYTDISMYK